MGDPRTAVRTLQRAAATGELDGWCEPRGVRLLVVFGSAAEPEPLRPPEDLDVAVLLDADGDALSLADDLAGWLHVEVDVMDLAVAGVVARDQALRLALPLYERVAGTFAATQMTAAGMRMDTTWLRRLDLALMAER